MLEVPVQALPNQNLQVQLGDQPCTIHIAQSAFGLFLDLSVNGVAIINGVICENLNRMVRSLYLGFLGDLLWVDLQGADDPTYPGLGDRFRLIWVSPDELPPGVG